MVALRSSRLGCSLIATATRLPQSADLTGGNSPIQPAVKALAAVLLAAAAVPPDRAGTALAGQGPGVLGSWRLLAMPWWEPSFVLGLAAFCSPPVLPDSPVAAGPAVRTALVAVALTVVADAVAPDVVLAATRRAGDGCAGGGLHRRCWGRWCAVLLPGCRHKWTALGAVCSAVSDAMIGISEFGAR